MHATSSNPSSEPAAARRFRRDQRRRDVAGVFLWLAAAAFLGTCWLGEAFGRAAAFFERRRFGLRSAIESD